MTERDPTVVITHWLEEGPNTVPDSARRRILNEVLSTPQLRRVGLRPRGSPLAERLALGVAGLAAIVLIAVGVIVELDPSQVPAGPGGPGPTASAATSPLVPPSQPRGPSRVDGFLRPFEYVPTEALEFDAVAATLVLESSVADTSGVSIWAVDEVLADPCKPYGEERALPPGRAALVQFVQKVKGLTVTRTSEIVLDGRPATQLWVTPADTGPCERLHAWRDSGPTYETLNLAPPEESRLTIVDVGDTTVVIEAWSSDGLQAWLDAVDPGLSSIRFMPPTEATAEP